MSKLARTNFSKSRHGCVVCKRKKIKCDEKKPTCGSCQRLLISCNYENQPRNNRRNALSPQQPFSPFEGQAPNAIEKKDSLQPLDCELIYHWMKNTAYTFSNDAKRTDVWTTVFPQLAFKHDFLLHTLLATSSLHLACTTNNARNQANYFFACDRHFHWAIKQYREQLFSLSNQNCEALFACGMLLFISAFSEKEEEESISTSERSEESEPTLAQGIRFMREGRTLFKPFLPHIMVGCLGPLLAEPDPSSFLIDHPGILTDFESLCKGSNEAHLTAYNQAIASLKIAYASRGCGSPLKMVGSWPLTLSDVFVEILETEDARALVILAHYCAVAHASSRCWWATQNQIERRLRKIEEKVGEAWGSWLKWPKSVISLTVVKEDGLRH